MPTVEQLSVGLDGKDGDGDSGAADLSPGGRYVAFISEASNLVAGDTNNVSDVFLLDRQTATMERLSIAGDGSQSNGASGGAGFPLEPRSEPPAVSADGGLVAFTSDATNLVPGDDNGASDVFLVDRVADTIIRISTSRLGQTEDGASFAPAMTPDGRFVAFTSTADNLVAGDGNGEADVFLLDRQTNGLARISEGARGLSLDTVEIEATTSAISSDGRFVVFGFGGERLAALPSDNQAREAPSAPNVDVGTFVYDRVTGETVFLGRSTTYTEEAFTEPALSRAAISGDGGTVAFVNGKIVVESGVGGSDTYPEVTVVDRASGNELSTIHHQWLRTFSDLPNPMSDLSLNDDGSVLALSRGLGLRGPGTVAEIVDLETDFSPSLRVPTADNTVIATVLSDDGSTLVYASQNMDRFGPPDSPFQLQLQSFGGSPDFSQPQPTEGQVFQGGPVVGDNLAIVPGTDVRITYLDEAAKYQSSLGAYLVDGEGRFIATEIAFARIEDADKAPGLPDEVRPGGGPLETGDSVLLSSLFDAEDLDNAVQFGLFLVADGANLNPAERLDPSRGDWRFVEERVGTFPAPGLDSVSPSLFFEPDDGGPAQRIQGDIFHTTDLGSPLSPAAYLNPDNADHTVQGAKDGDLEIRFEDLRVVDAVSGQSSGDRDFNDLTILITREPA